MGNSVHPQDIQDNKHNKAESLSLALDMAHEYGNSKRDVKVLTTSLAKFRLTPLEKVQAEVDEHVAGGRTENPAAYANRLAVVFAEAEREARAVKKLNSAARPST